MVDKNRDPRIEYIGSLADRMGLQDWAFELSHEPIEGEPHEDNVVQAQCHVSYGRKHACIQIAENWYSWSACELRRVVVHELVHSHFEHCRWVFHTALGGQSLAAKMALEDAFTHAMEMAIDGIAVAWAERLPLLVEENSHDQDA